MVEGKIDPPVVGPLGPPHQVVTTAGRLHERVGQFLLAGGRWHQIEGVTVDGDSGDVLVELACMQLARRPDAKVVVAPTM